jgi:hypothetical protein
MIQFKLFLITYFILAIALSKSIFGFVYYDLISFVGLERLIVFIIVYTALSHAWKQGEKELILNNSQ